MRVKMNAYNFAIVSISKLRARLRAGLSQAQLAARMGTSPSTIARLESGQALPSTKTLLRYAEAIGSKFHVRLSALDARLPSQPFSARSV
jgi:transcriptional regulator with XRE-family HTH domain